MAAPMLVKGAVLAATNPRKAGKVLKGVLGTLFGLTLVAGFTGAALVGQASALLSAASERPQVASCVDGAELAAGTTGALAVFPLPDGTWSTSSPYGQRVHPVFGTVRMHDGADFAAADGTPLLAVFDGVVSRVSFPASGNNSVTVTSLGPSGEDLKVLYMHMWPSGIFVTEGALVRAGDPIGTVGNSGTSTGAHLHLETRVDGRLVDPVPFLAQYGAIAAGSCELLER